MPAQIITMTAVVPGCGNNLIESGEECDGTALASASCQSKGFTSGTLSCTTSCFYNTTACTNSSVGSGGGGSSASTNNAQVVLSGRAYPGSKVTVLKDAQVVATTIADDAAFFQISVKSLAAGTYVFSLYSEDNRTVRSAIRTFPISVTRGIVAKIENIYLAPTISGDKTAVRHGDPIIFFGQSAPESNVMLEVHSAQPFVAHVATAKDGVYLYNFSTTPLELGSHAATAQLQNTAIVVPKSDTYGFTVGTQNVYSSTTAPCSKKADLNTDCRVNLVDFSIAAYWYDRTLSPSFSVREKKYLNGDGRINLVDFSIMAYYWTG